MVKISMMPLRGLPFGVRLNARLGTDALALLMIRLLGQPQQKPDAGEEQSFACRSMRRLHAKRQPWLRRLPTLAKCSQCPTRRYLLGPTFHVSACARRTGALAAAGRTARDALGSPYPRECSTTTNQFTADRAASQQLQSGDCTSSAACIALRMTPISH
jgi:hypothetical protein